MDRARLASLQYSYSARIAVRLDQIIFG